MHFAWVAGCTTGHVPRLLCGVALKACVAVTTMVVWPALGSAQGLAPRLTPAPDLSALSGARLRKIVLVSVPGRWAPELTLTSVRPGDAFSPALVRRALTELTATGLFASAAAEVEESDGVVLRLIVEPRRIVRDVRMTGGVLDSAETLRAAGVGLDAEVTVREFAQIAERIEALYARHGYPAARVSVSAADIDEPMRVLLTIHIEPSSQQLLSSLEFTLTAEGSPVGQALLDDYRVQVGDPAEESALVQADLELERRMRETGFHNASVTHQVSVVSDARVAVRVLVAGGPRFQVRLIGNQAFSDQTLFGILDLRDNPDRAPSALAERLEETYVSAGYLNADVTARVKMARGPYQRVLELHVKERGLVRIRGRSYPCLTGPLSVDAVSQEVDSFLEEAALPEPPASEIAVNELFGGKTVEPTMTRAQTLQPDEVFNPRAYARAAKHLTEVYRGHGFLSAEVGPARLLRRKCRDGGRTCRPDDGATAADVHVSCDADASGLVKPCVPDAARGIACESSGVAILPIRVGVQTFLFDFEFSGNETLSESTLAAIARLKTERPLSFSEIETARERIRVAYAERGYPFANIDVEPGFSPDRSRATLRFLVAEGPEVRVSGVIVEGTKHTGEHAYRERIALAAGDVYTSSAARLTEEQLASLGVFSSVSVSLENPTVPAPEKYVVVQVVERKPQYLELGAGISSGEGFRASFGYGNRNLGGRAVGMTLRAQAGYLPPEFIFAEDLRGRIYPSRAACQGPRAQRSVACDFNLAQLLDYSASVSFGFPNVGLGPRVRLRTELLGANDLTPNYVATRVAARGGLVYRPTRQITGEFDLTAEQPVAQVLGSRSEKHFVFVPGTTDRIPSGRSIALSQGLSVRWDRRDQPLNATTGTFVSGAAEHVTARPCSENALFSECTPPEGLPDLFQFLRMSARVSGYLRLHPRLVLAASLRGGYIVPLISSEETYPDRLFFMGGVGTLRSYALDTLMPQDIADYLVELGDTPEGREELFKAQVRGGNVFINPRVELRIPLTQVLQTGVFLDMGNLWFDRASFDPLALRYGLGAGVRVNTPIGPLAFDYAFNLFPRWWEVNEQLGPGAFHFSIGLF